MSQFTTLQGTLDEGAAREYLSVLRWPNPLQDSLLKNISLIPIRYFICDDSGSMAAMDGSKVIANGSAFRYYLLK